MTFNKTIEHIDLYENYETATTIIDDKVKHGNQVEAFYVCEIRDLIRKYKLWNSVFPHIKPYYAVKSNNTYMVIKILNMLGAHFDCASKSEIDLVLSAGGTPDRIMYAHVMKPTAYLKYAHSLGIKIFTFDNEDELHKIKNISPNCQVLLRINVDKSKIIPKFGCNVAKDADRLIKLARELKINAVGVCFHVGTFTKNPEVYEDAIKLSRDVFNLAKTAGYSFSILNIGGAYPGSDNALFREFSVIINSALKTHFGDLSVEVIAEPGNFFVDSAFSLACSVITKKYRENKWAYYINDGIYGSFDIRKRFQVPIKMHPLKKYTEAKLYDTIIFGATCSDIDIITANVSLPALNIGDWLIFKNMGAYTICIASTFNGFQVPKTFFVIDLESWNYLNEKCDPVSSYLHHKKVEYKKSADINMEEEFTVTYCVDQLHRY